MFHDFLPTSHAVFSSSSPSPSMPSQTDGSVPPPAAQSAPTAPAPMTSAQTDEPLPSYLQDISCWNCSLHQRILKTFLAQGYVYMYIYVLLLLLLLFNLFPFGH